MVRPTLMPGCPRLLIKGLTHTRSFEGMTIDGALRHFLSGFWLPGEAQKIDRCFYM